ncbi:hypothetical protein CRUP_012114, partial [Coryphaenoides rupestris]
EFSFPQVWGSNQQPLHCAFSLERYSPAPTQLSCKISVRQTDCSVTSQTGPRAFKIPLSIRQRICATFDTAGSPSKDWQLLAQKLHLDRLWEARHQDSADLDSLASALEEISQIHSRSPPPPPGRDGSDSNRGEAEASSCPPGYTG